MKALSGYNTSLQKAVESAILSHSRAEPESIGTGTKWRHGKWYRLVKRISSEASRGFQVLALILLSSVPMQADRNVQVSQALDEILS